MWHDTTRAQKHGIGRRATFIVLLVVMAALVACGMGAAGTPAGGDPDQNGAAASAASGPGDGEPGGNPPPLAAPIERQIIKTGEITIRVSSVATAVGQVRALALSLDGYVGASQAGTDEDPATLTLRVPADRFDEAIGRLHDIGGEVLAEATREDDVTSQIVDLRARIGNLEASEVQYRALVERAQRVADILSVQARLDDVRGQIEQLKAQLEQVSGQATLSTLTVTIVPPDEPVERAAAGWNPGGTVDNAAAALVGLGQGIGTVAIWLIILGIPIALVIAAVGLVALRARPGIRRRIAGPGPE